MRGRVSENSVGKCIEKLGEKKQFAKLGGKFSLLNQVNQVGEQFGWKIVLAKLVKICVKIRLENCVEKFYEKFSEHLLKNWYKDLVEHFCEKDLEKCC